MDETEASVSFAARVPLNNELILSCSIFFLQRCEARHSFMLKWHLWADSWTISLMLCSGAEFMVRGTDALHKPSSVWPAHMQTVCFSTISNGKASEAFCRMWKMVCYDMNIRSILFKYKALAAVLMSMFFFASTREELRLTVRNPLYIHSLFVMIIFVSQLSVQHISGLSFFSKE